MCHTCVVQVQSQRQIRGLLGRRPAGEEVLQIGQRDAAAVLERVRFLERLQVVAVQLVLQVCCGVRTSQRLQQGCALRACTEQFVSAPNTALHCAMGALCSGMGIAYL